MRQNQISHVVYAIDHQAAVIGIRGHKIGKTAVIADILHQFNLQTHHHHTRKDKANRPQPLFFGDNEQSNRNPYNIKPLIDYAHALFFFLRAIHKGMITAKHNGLK